MQNGKINIAVIGLGLGERFLPIYQNHPDVESVGICDADNERLVSIAKKYNVEWTHTDLDEVLKSDRYDTVHILTPVNTHGPITINALKAGKHCAVAVPMGLSIEELEGIIHTVEETGLNYMMMETKVYGHNYMYARSLYNEGKLGRIQFMRGCHSQDLEEINPVWRGFPPMWYMTHASAPILDILDTRAEEVHCYGSGKMRDEFTAYYNNPYPIETAIFALEGTDVKAEITRTLFETAPYGWENFDFYGDKATFVTIGHYQPLLITLSPLTKTYEKRKREEISLEIPYQHDLLPKEIVPFVYNDPYYGGSLPHLVHEFVRSIIEKRQPYIHARRSANWTAPGICAHISAMKNGEGVRIPKF